jgi:hypothetical protein
MRGINDATHLGLSGSSSTAAAIAAPGSAGSPTIQRQDWLAEGWVCVRGV